MSEEIKNKLWNIELVVEDIKQFPQTYDTILQGLRSNGTCQTILRRKLSKLHKRGIVNKTVIPGTRFGKTLFYVLPKKYHILVEGTRTGSLVCVFFEYEQLSRFYIRIDKYWVLGKSAWIEKGDVKIIFQGNTLKWV